MRRDVLLIRRWTRLINRWEYGFLNQQRNHILLNNLWSMVRSFRVLISVLQGIFPILSPTVFSTPRERLRMNLSNRGLFLSPPAQVVPHTLYLGIENGALIHQHIDVCLALVLDPSQCGQCCSMTIKASTVPVPSGVE